MLDSKKIYFFVDIVSNLYMSYFFRIYYVGAIHVESWIRAHAS